MGHVSFPCQKTILLFTNNAGSRFLQAKKMHLLYRSNVFATLDMYFKIISFSKEETNFRKSFDNDIEQNPERISS